ncbi:hypothetical protein VTK56DRAFT_6799 [Thermocarpiscus australiensis]
MPPSRRKAQGQGSAPASRAYESTPVPQQVHFPARRRIVRTYGRRSLPAASAAAAAARSPQQRTLTQIDFVRSSSGGVRAEEDEEGELEDWEEVGVERRRGGKRRKTMGDTPASSFHTQTLTQLLGASGSGRESGVEGGLRIEDEDDEQDGEGEDQLPLGKTPIKRRSPDRGAKAVAFDPHTPSHKRIKVNLDEVPSSQPTPFTPMLDRYSPMPSRSPLKEKSTNVDAPPPTVETISKLPRNLVIQDSYSLGSGSSLPSSSLATETPRKVEETPSDRPKRQPLAEIPVASLELGADSTSAGESIDQTPTGKKVAGAKRAFVEIPDSDDELESIGSTPFKPRDTQQRPLKKGGAAERIEILRDPGSSSRPEISGTSETPAPSTGKSDKENKEPVLVVGDDESTASEDEESGTPSPTPRKTRSQTAQGTSKSSQKTSNHATESQETLTQDVDIFGISGTTANNTASQPVSKESRVNIEEAPGSPTPVPRKLGSQRRISIGDANQKPRKPTSRLQPEDEESTASEDEGQTMPIPSPRKTTPTKASLTDDSCRRKRDSTPQIPTSGGSTGEGEGTPTPAVRRVQIELPPPPSVEQIYEETPRKSLKKSSPVFQRQTQGRSQYYSQGLESQRVPLDVIRSLGPQTDRSDILISIQPDLVDQIVKGTKDHEFRSYKFPSQVSRCWIYTARPVGEVKYMATLGPAQEPGQIDSSSGLGNAEFNAGTSGYKYAHKLLQVYQLNNPVPLADMPDNGLGNGPPQKYRYIPPAIVGQLLANLRCALFADWDEEEEEELESRDGVTISQELEEQLRSDIIHSTQMLSSEGHRRHEEEENVIPASQSPPVTGSRTVADAVVEALAKGRGGIRAAAAMATVTAPMADEDDEDDDDDDDDLSARRPAPTRSSQRIRNRNQEQSPSYHKQQTRQQKQQQRTPSTIIRKPSTFVRPSQATTASDASSSPPEKSQKSSAPASVPRPPPPDSNEPSLPDLAGMDVDDDDASLSRLPPVVVGSSSQAVLLPPDSLLVDEVRQPPPPVIWDSEEEDDDGLD